MKANIMPGQIYQIKKGLISQKMDEETVIFDGQKSLLFTLNETGAFIFQKIKAHWPKTKIISTLVDRYGISDDKANKDVVYFLTKLTKLKVISPAKSTR